ncbi:MAG TPA: C40 family peptidase [Nitrospiria bacterium]|nr:C40 family peptidase [Nitrospiria bacterium]
MLRLLAIALVGLLLAACSGTPLPREAKGRPGLDLDALRADSARPISETRQRVIATAAQLVGTPYKFGGTTPKGFDCTGYLMYVFRKAANVALPRTSMEQIQAGDPIPPSQLQPADLVYFRIDRKKDLHLGLYLGEGRFIHAPSSGGAVNIQRLDMEYWRTRFLGARRVLSL